jgi:hypothetical protein
VWATQLFPFADPVALHAAMEFETSVYRAMNSGAGIGPTS